MRMRALYTQLGNAYLVQACSLDLSADRTGLIHTPVRIQEERHLLPLSAIYNIPDINVLE